MADRRAFLRGKVQRPSVVSAPITPITANNPLDERLTYALPRERVRLLLLERAWPPTPEQTIAPGEYGFAGMTIDEERCTLCGWCAGFCPTAALEWWQDNDMLRLVFQPLRCLDCAICAAACPVDAVHQLEALPAAYLRDTLLLAEDVSQECATCGRLTAAQQGEQCVWCRGQTVPLVDRLDLPWDALFPAADDR